MNNPSNALIDQLVEKYGVGQNYAAAYAGYWSQSRGRQYDSLSEILADPMPLPMWFGYAMETNARGKALVDRIRPQIPASACRSLDVGCGFGGVMYSLAAQGMDAVGIDLDPVRIPLAQANCLDSGGKAHAFIGDVLDDDMVKNIGKFDIITCTDVLEHVKDPRQAMQNMVSLLNPGGILYLEVPNKDSLKFVTSDGHFSLFGITLLPRPEAVRYHAKFFNFKYDVGYYYPIHYYTEHLRKIGCESRVDAPPFQPIHRNAEIPGLAKKLVIGFLAFLLVTAKKLSFGLSASITLRFLAFLTRFLIDLPIYKINKNRGFQQKYLMDFWEITARKNEH
jgi:2-polyprenyl-3-methyl-5-hydroxy-6-metoxy-1,4-benzoquinol methylase